MGAHVATRVGPEELPDPDTLGLALSAQSPIAIATIVSYVTLYRGDGASNGAQYTPRYRELTSGAESDASPGGYPDNGQHYADETRQSARPQPAEWDPRTQGYR